MGINSLQQPFLQATNPYGQYQKPAYENTYHQARVQQGVPNTTPQVFGLPSVEDMELASKIASGEYGNFENSNIFMPRTSGVSSPQNIKGAAWDGYNVPMNNGTGELSPVVENREDEIENCPWAEYYA